LLSPMDVPYDLVSDGLESFGMRVSRQELPWQEG
jgi:hypothetical protein